jgi:hypothetical protein
MSALFYLSARGTHATVLGGQKRSAEGAAASFRVHDVKTKPVDDRSEATRERYAR